MHKADWMRQKKWGIMVHYLQGQKSCSAGNLFAPEVSWDECVNTFDVQKFVRTLHSLNAGYVVFTVMQGFQYMCAPNETFNKISGYKTGEACSSRDLIAELADELKKYDIKLILYFTGDGPYLDEKGGKAFGMYSADSTTRKAPITAEFVKKWASVMEEYAVRYGEKVSGWWVDGCYSYVGYNDTLLKYYKDAALAGNPNAVVAMNNGVHQPVDNEKFFKKAFEYPKYCGDMMYVAKKLAAEESVDVKELYCHPGPQRYSKYEDFTAGEENEFEFYPSENASDDIQWHTLSFLGLPNFDCGEQGKSGWCNIGCKYSGKELRDYVDKVNSLGGAVTVEAKIFRDGSMEIGQLEILKYLSDINA